MRSSSMFAVILLTASLTWAQVDSRISPAPNRKPGEGEGPFDRLVIRGVTVIDGTGAQPRGSMDIVVERDRITEVRSVGVPHVAIDESGRPAEGARGLDATGMYLMPGFVDLHTHTGGAPKAPDAEYVYKLWMAHRVTTARLRNRSLQFFPADQNYNDEQMHWSAQGRIWEQIYPRGSKQWNELLQYFLDHHAVLDPTMSAYAALRDRMRAGTAEWLEKYALPSM
jgi:N-acyl-D-aspartate/D-glutamate deacylase